MYSGFPEQCALEPNVDYQYRPCLTDLSRPLLVAPAQIKKTYKDDESIRDA
jgi:hypothetical protein